MSGFINHLSQALNNMGIGAQVAQNQENREEVIPAAQAAAAQAGAVGPHALEQVNISVPLTLSNSLKKAEAQLLKAMGHLDKPNERGQTPLVQAVIDFDLEKVDILLEAGASINCTVNHQNLLTACLRYRNPEILEKYLGLGARFVENTSTLGTYIYESMNPVRFNFLKTIVTNLDPHIHINDVKYGLPAQPILYWAIVDGGDLKSIELLLQHGANFDELAEKKLYPIQDRLDQIMQGNAFEGRRRLMQFNHRALLELLFKYHQNLGISDEEGNSILHIGMRTLDKSIIQFYVDVFAQSKRQAKSVSFSGFQSFRRGEKKVQLGPNYLQIHTQQNERKKSPLSMAEAHLIEERQFINNEETIEFLEDYIAMFPKKQPMTEQELNDMIVAE